MHLKYYKILQLLLINNNALGIEILYILYSNNTSLGHRPCLDRVDPRLPCDPHKILHLDL